MKMKRELKGVFPALVTPFDRQGEVNEEMLRKVVEYQLQAGVQGFYVWGLIIAMIKHVLGNMYGL